MHCYNKKIKNKKFVLTGMVILVIFLIAFTVYSIKYNRKATFAERVIKDSFSYIINIASTPFKLISDKWEIFVNADKIYVEYGKLKDHYNSSFLTEISPIDFGVPAEMLAGAVITPDSNFDRRLRTAFISCDKDSLHKRINKTSEEAFFSDAIRSYEM